MISLRTLDQFLDGTRGQAVREGTRYHQEGRVEGLKGDGLDFSAQVGGTGEYEVCLGSDSGVLQFGCSCPSWRSPCKHVVATVLSLREMLGIRDQALRLEREKHRGEARQRAIKERQHSAAGEKFVLQWVQPPFVEVTGASEFTYRVRLRGDFDGPHSCECPDFEANRLHTCKHIERVRMYLKKRRTPLATAYQKEIKRSHVYLWFGQELEPRLFGSPRGKGAAQLRARFGTEGRPRRKPKSDRPSLLRFLKNTGRADPRDLAWLSEQVARTPKFPKRPFASFLPELPMSPYPYQWTGAEFLARRGRALLADEMGLGKTMQAILAAVAMRHAKDPVEHVTIVCPASLRSGWQDEIKRWVGEDSTLLVGRADKRKTLIASRPRWLITHYEQVLRDHRAHTACPPDLLILDEAQRTKNFRARTSRVVKAIGARHIFALTGTPLENRIEEAYAIAQLIDQRLLPPLWQFDRDHFVRENDKPRVIAYRGLDDVRSRLSPAFLRRRKEDVDLELPERTRSVLKLPMHALVTDTYEETMAAIAKIARRQPVRPRDMDRLQRLFVIARRCCDGPHMFGHEVADEDVPKLAMLADLLREVALDEGRKVVVFSEWTDMTLRAEALVKNLGLPVFHLSGQLAVPARPKLIRDFEQIEGPAVFVSSDAGGVGLNLQVADVVINLDLPWNPAKLEQRVARVHRIGSGSAVREVNLICAGSIEERILALHSVKQNVLDSVWSNSGDDFIVAPGGSGGFRKLLAELLDGQEAEEEDAEDVEEQVEAKDERPGERESNVASPLDDRVERGVPEEGEQDSHAISNNSHPVPEPDSPGAALAPKMEQPALAPPDTAELQAPSSEAAMTLDPNALAAAIGAIAPSLPAAHRAALSMVFRVLADALEP